MRAQSRVWLHSFSGHGSCGTKPQGHGFRRPLEVLAAKPVALGTNLQVNLVGRDYWRAILNISREVSAREDARPTNVHPAQKTFRLSKA